MKITLGLMLSIFFYSQALHAGPGVIVLGGGGPEGDIGVTTDWSYHLYKRLIENGDVTGDKKISAVVISLEQPGTNFIIDYLKSMGAHSAVNLVVSNKNEAFEKKVNVIDEADVLFIRGGNQGLNYQFWKDTPLHNKIEALAKRGGAIGGTSSGSMIISQYTMTGGRDYNSPDVLENSHSRVLRDIKRRKSTGIHDDFLNLIPNLIVDTHCAERARLGRILGVHAKAVEDYQNKNIVSLCLEERTGVAIKNNRAQVYGTGVAHFIQETDKTKVIREIGTPLVYTDMKDDALTNGWVFDLNKREVDLKSMPTNTFSIPPYVIKRRSVLPFNIFSQPVKYLGIQRPKDVTDLIIIPDAFSESLLTTGERKLTMNHTNGLLLIYKHPEASVVFLNAGTTLVGDENADIKITRTYRETSMLVLDCSECTHKSLSPYTSNQAYRNAKTYSPALLNLRLHALDSRASYNFQTRRTRLLVPEFHMRDTASKSK